jgi:hypothetical protein
MALQGHSGSSISSYREERSKEMQEITLTTDDLAGLLFLAGIAGALFGSLLHDFFTMAKTGNEDDE